ncbi:MAG TPA: glycosyltransferase [Bryobacteraceae bacterium]|jgi:spore maturation protein CgeB
MKIVVFGLAVSSAWGNGHATLLRGLFRALHSLGHDVHFFERDTPYYASHRDATSLPFAALHLYSAWKDVLPLAAELLRESDVGMVTSYCPDGAAACELLLGANIPRSVFYDMDTPVTLSRLQQGQQIDYVPGSGLQGFDLVLSYTGGMALEELRNRLGARCVATLYGWVDPEIHHRVPPSQRFAADLSYLGTYSADRQHALEDLLLRPARSLLDYRFVIGGAMHPEAGLWPENVRYFDHVAPPDHPAFYSSAPLTLNVTRGSMAAMGYCPSGRLFEAAACGTAVLSDWWAGLDSFFEPGEEILIAASTADAIPAITKDKAALSRIGMRARERALDCHTAQIRAQRLIRLFEAPTSVADAGELTSAKGA